MASRLKIEEKRNILRLHAQGLTMKELREKTGRSREAISAFLAECGIDDGSISLPNRIEWKAERMYEHIRRSNRDKKMPWFRELSAVEHNKYVLEARKEYMAEAQQLVDMIMNDDTPVINREESARPILGVEISAEAKEKLNYISAVYKIGDINLLLDFIITKEYLHALHAQKLPEYIRKDKSNVN